VYNSNDIANKIKETAKAQGISVKAMLSSTNLGVNTLQHMKTSIPKSDTLALIADYLNVSVDYLLGREVQKNAPDSIRSAVINAVNRLPEEKLDRLLGYLEALAQE
jgi:transcriptional regulator with XRE-family HTH domain